MYMALYRQWRPKTFAEMVGQEHVRQTLGYALAQQKVAHAYLFSGPRGTGKTTVARLLAKSLNCRNRQGTEPCKGCPSCLEIDQGVSMDVVEIDAASNRGIDEIRDLREKVRLAPAGGGYKVYIIDEVHMLTAEAFNALLKTLEDPPEGVVFILATTEAHRVPATILSRVQHFEFRRIALKEIEAHLSGVCAALERQAEPEALHVIALKCEGSLRDALSMLDQCLSRDGRIGREDVLRQLGMMGENGSADFVEGLLRGGYADILRQMDEHMAAGRDPRQMLRELLDYLRDMMIFLAGGSLSPRSQEALGRLGEQAEEAGLDRVLAWIHLILQGEAELKFAPNARLAVEMLLVQAVYRESGAAALEGAGPEGKRAAVKMPASAKRAEPSKATASSERASSGAAAASKISAASKTAAPSKTSELSAPSLQSRASSSESGPGQESLPEREASVEWTPEIWEKIVSLIRQKSKPVHAFLLSGTPSWNKDKLWVVFPRAHAFNCDMINQEKNRKVLAAAVREVLGREVAVEGTVEMPETAATEKTGKVEKAQPSGGEPGAAAQKDPSGQRAQSAPSAQTAHDAVERAMAIFGSDVVVVREDRD